MDLSSHSIASTAASRMLPRLSPSPASLSHHHHRAHSQQQKAAGNGDGEFTSRCASTSNSRPSSSSSSSGSKMGVEGESEGSQQRPTDTFSRNGEPMEGQSKGNTLGKESKEKDHGPDTSPQAASTTLFPCPPRCSPQQNHPPIDPGSAETHHGPPQQLHDSDVEMKDDDEEEDDDDPVGCETCGEDFSTMQAYVSHACASAVSSSPTQKPRTPTTNANPEPAEDEVLAYKSGTRRDAYDLTQNREGLDHSNTGEQYSAPAANGTPAERGDAQDAESFVGKIVYNPDGSAYVIEGDESDDADLELLDVPKLEGAIVERNGGGAPSTSASSSPPIPQIASAVFVSRPFSARSKSVSNVRADTSGSSTPSAPDGAPTMHSFRVYNVRDPKDSGTARGASDPGELKGNCHHPPHPQLPANPILMCFMCKLSFGVPLSFVKHARDEHRLELTEEERSILARPKASAIMQGVGREKTPLLSFLEPLLFPTSSSSSSSSSSTSTSAPFTSFFMPSSAGSPVTPKVASAATKVKYMYTAPRMSKDIAMSPASGSQASGGSQGAEEENEASPDCLVTSPRVAGEGGLSSSSSSVAVRMAEQENGSAERGDTGTRPNLPFSFDWLKGSRGGLANSSRTPAPDPSPSAVSPEAGGPTMNSGAPPKAAKEDAPSIISFSATSQELSPPDFPSTPVSMFPLMAAGGTCDEHPLGRVPGTDCPKCDMALGTAQSLGGHMTMMHSRNSCKTLKCPKCNWHYKYQETLEIHMKEKHPDSDAQCIYCLTSQPHPRLARGETYSCGYKPYRCDVCNYSTTTKGNLSIHMQSDKHMNNMQELANGGSDMTGVTASNAASHSQGQTKSYTATPSSGGPPPGVGGEDPLKKLKPKQSWRCDVCNYETLVARNLRIHMTSEKHTHNMMVLQQNMKHMQRDMQLQQFMLMGQQDPLAAPWPPGALPPGMYPAYEQSLMVAAGAPSLYDMSTMGLSLENGAVVGPGEETTPSTSEASDTAMLYQCTICELHASDSLESLHQHINVDRTKQRESENISVQNGTYTCHMCQYKTNLKANFQLHCKTDKHLQKLQMTNHIREGGPANEWRLAYLTASNPTTVRCNACNFYASSVHKLQLHATQLSHDNNAHVFRLLQVALARMQQSAASANAATSAASSSSGYYYRCVVCGCNTRTKQAMVRHAMSLKHVQQQQAKQHTIDLRDVYVAVLVRDGETVVFEDAGDGERGHNNHTCDGNPDTPSAPDKLDPPTDAPNAPTPSSTSTSSAGTNNNFSNLNNNGVLALTTKTDVGGPVVPEKIHSAATHDNPDPDSGLGQGHTRRSVTPASKSGPTEGATATTAAGGSISSQKAPVLPCPVCQHECGQDVASVEAHLAAAHNVPPEAMQKMLSMLELPPSVVLPQHHQPQALHPPQGQPHPAAHPPPPPVPPSAAHEPETAADVRIHAGSAAQPGGVGATSGSEAVSSSPLPLIMLTSASSLSPSGPSFGALREGMELDVQRLEAEHDQLLAESCVVESSTSTVADQTDAEGFRCQICTRTFSNIDLLYAHQNELGHLELKQTPRGPGYLCWKKGCNQYFKTAQSLQIHFREIHARKTDADDAERPFHSVLKCLQCARIFRDTRSLQLHRLYHMIKAITQCSLCTSCFNSVQAYRSHLENEHLDLSQTEMDGLQNALDTNIASLTSSPGCELFMAKFLGCELPKDQSSSALNFSSSSSERSSVNKVEKNSQGKSASRPKGVDALAADIAKKVEEKTRVLESARQQDDEDEEESLEKKFPDQQALEEFINSQAMVEGSFEDPNKKFKCQRCRVGFSKQSYLTAHNKTQQHRLGRGLSSYVTERYNDPSRPYKCDVCKESFTQKNILLVHYNSVSHLHTVNKVASSLGALPASVTSLPSDLSPSTSPSMTNGNGNNNGTSNENSSSSKKPYKCNLCNTSYSQSTNLEIHTRSVAHQTRIAKLHELVLTGQVNPNQQLIENPDLDMDAAMQAQQMQLYMELMQQQQLSSPQSLMFPGLPGLNSMSMLQGMPPLFPTSTSSNLFSSPTTAALASYANAAAMETEHATQMMQLSQSAEKASRKNVEKSVETTKREKAESDTGTPKAYIAVKSEPMDDYIDGSFADSFADSVVTSVAGFKSEMSTNTVDTSLLSKTSDQPSNPILAASIPVMIARPRGFMGRFKPQIHRNLLENIGFECVMQFNEYTQHKKKGKGKTKDGDDNNEDKENQEKKVDEEEDLQMETADTKEDEEKEEKEQIDMPEINKSHCLQCGSEFSSVFVLKAHEEQVHKTVVPIDIVQDFGEKFKEDFEKKQPKPEPESVAPPPVTVVQSVAPATTTTVTTTSTSSNTTSTSSSEKVSIKASKEEMPPPPPPPPQLPSPYDMAQMMPMLGMMPMGMPMNLMSLGMQSPLVSMMPGGGMDMSGGFPLNLMMDPSLVSAQQQMQQAAATVAANNQKRVRTRISDEQLKILRAHFDINNSPTEAQINQMSEQSGLPQKVIKHWFRNTLFKERQRNKDSPYNFSNPPSTTIDLEEYEKTGKIPAAPTSASVKVEPCDEEDDAQSLKQDDPEPEPRMDTPQPQPPLSFMPDLLPRSELEERREYESRSNTSTPSNLSSIPSTPTCSAPPTPTPAATASTANILDNHAMALAREAAAAQNALSKRANRTRFTDYQVKILQEYFEQNAYPKDDELDHLSKILNLSPRVIVVWFQNARQKARKIYENQPAAETKESTSPFQRTPSLNYQCKKCGAVFQRYYELIKHQKRPCLSENNNNKPLPAITDDDSLSSCTSFDDSGLNDSLNLSVSSQKEAVSPSALANAFRCDKCNASFNRADLWQEHQKIHNLNTNLFPPFSSNSAFGMLQSLAQQEDSKATVSTASMPSTPTSTSSSFAMSPVSPNKRKIELIDDERLDDQPRDKRLRTTILPEQLDYLYQKYQLDCNPSRKQLETIAQEVGLKKRVVQVWFQNTRARERKGQYRAHQQLIHKRCPFCRALFRAKSALESHLATKHPEEMAKGEINVDAIPDAAIEPPQPAHSMPSTSSTSLTPGSGSSGVADLGSLLSPSSMQPYLSFMPPTNLTMGFPSVMSSDPIQMSMQHLYEDAYKKYITELSGTAPPPPPPPPLPTAASTSKSSHVTPEPLISSGSNRHSGKLVEKRAPPPAPAPAPAPAASGGDDDAPLDLSVSVKPSSDSKTSSSHSTHDRSSGHSSERPSSQGDKTGNNHERSLNLSLSSSSSSSFNNSANTNGPQTSSACFIEKANREFERNRHNSYEDSYSETHSEFNDSEYQGDMGSSPSSPKSNTSNPMGQGQGQQGQHGHVQKRYRTQMTSLQVKVMKLLFIDYKTPTMAECELLGREIGLPKRVVQVWFQNARAKEKKCKLTMSKNLGTDVDFPKTPEECALCNFKYSHKFTVQDHIFTKRHIDNAKKYIQNQSDAEREISDPAAVSGLLRQQSHDVDRKMWENTSSSSSSQQQQLAQLQQGLNAAAFSLSSGLPGVASPFTLGSVPLAPETSSKKSSLKENHKDNCEKKSEPSATTPSSGSNSGSNKDHHHQQQQQPTPQQAAELAQMMALGGYLPGLDPTSYLSYMYAGLPGFFPGMTAMPLLQPGILPGAEHMLAYDPLSFGTPLPLLQIPAQAIKNVSEKVLDPNCVLAHYTQDCKSLADLKGSLSSMDLACLVDSPVDVGYICKKCQMVYPVRDACLTHQRMACYTAGGHGGKTMLKLEQFQYECRVCSEKFSTLAEVKAHCHQDLHKVKVHKLGASVIPSSSSSPSSATSSSSARSSPKTATSTTATPTSSHNTPISTYASGSSGDRASYTATSPASLVPSARKASPSLDKDDAKRTMLE